TCRNCDGNDCMNNILEDVLQQKILTSGYFGIFSSVKPTGKCSHGDSFDATRKSEPTGGINKDRLTSSHGHLHIEAANLAIAATSELLQDIRGAAGDRQFLQMMGINKGSSTALCFVVDTTGSMADEITAVKTVTSSIIDSKVGTEDEPSSYILVPFSDPDFGPLIRTTDPKVFKNYINSLTATGGGDFPEKILSGLQCGGQQGENRCEHQNITSTTGSSNTSSQMVGNLKTLHLPTKVGEWVMGMKSTNPYSLRVVGESPIDFVFDFLRESQGLLEGFDLVDNRPTAGGNGSLMVTLTGSDSATVTEVTLVESSGSGQVNGSVEARGGGEFFVRFDRIPSAEFVVLVKGQNSISRASSGIFQRQSTTSLRASTLTVTAEDSDMILEPGTPHSVHFSVMTSGTGRTFTIQAANDQGFNLTFPSTLSLDIGGSANGTVNLTTPLNTPSGTGVTLTIAAVAPGGVETNYDVLRFIVLPTVTDFTQPQCQLLSLQSSCSDNCSQSMWELSVQVTDGAEGTGVDHISLREGHGILNTSMAAGSENITLVSYTASCCLPDVQLVVVDGNTVCVYISFYGLRPRPLQPSANLNGSDVESHFV
ncbi:uncharacterized protein, partial [Leuresthes tenuis]|uniref:uncharacterized protein n=1 Tax=Leuresthes tenuis TaxID=355514 RepID=UPI003B50F3F9